jgi:TPR repeat protein
MQEESNANSREDARVLFERLMNVVKYKRALHAYRCRNYGKAFRIFRCLARKGHKGAQINLGHMYEHGLAVPVDIAQAEKWIGKSGFMRRSEVPTTNTLIE